MVIAAIARTREGLPNLAAPGSHSGGRYYDTDMASWRDLLPPRLFAASPPLPARLRQHIDAGHRYPMQGSDWDGGICWRAALATVENIQG